MKEDLVDPATKLRPDKYGDSAHQTIGIVDANAILSSVDNDCRTGWDSRLIRSTLFGSTALFAPDHVYREIYENLPNFVSNVVSLEDLRDRFETEYLPILRFVTVSMPEQMHPQVLAITDLDDRPTGQLAQLIAPVIVYTDDKDLINPGFAKREWRSTAGSTAVLAEAKVQETIVSAAFSLPIEGVFSGSAALGRRLNLPLWLPGVALLTLISAGMYATLLDPKRRANAKNIAFDLFEEVAKCHALHCQRQIAGCLEISRVIYPPMDNLTTRQQISIILARARKPLFAGEIHAKMIIHFGEEEVPPVKDVRAILNTGSEFFRIGPYRWQLGRIAGPRN